MKITWYLCIALAVTICTGLMTIHDDRLQVALGVIAFTLTIIIMLCNILLIASLLTHLYL